jgi:hypothetical protein
MRELTRPLKTSLASAKLPDVAALIVEIFFLRSSIYDLSTAAGSPSNGICSLLGTAIEPERATSVSRQATPPNAAPNPLECATKPIMAGPVRIPV